MIRAGRRRTLQVTAVAAALIWAWFASGVRAFTRPAEVLTFVPGLLVLLLVLRPRARPSNADVPGVTQAARAHRRHWRWPWLVFVVALVGLELAELFSQPRHSHPTLSSLTDSALSTHPSRFIGYAAWLALGWLMVRDLRTGRE